MAFKIAAGRAISEVLERDGLAVVLEPVVALEVAVENAGALVGDIGKRRGRVYSINNDSQRSVVEAIVPLAETFGYAGLLSAETVAVDGSDSSLLDMNRSKLDLPHPIRVGHFC